MKRWLCAVMAALLTISLCACGQKAPEAVPAMAPIPTLTDAEQEALAAQAAVAELDHALRERVASLSLEERVGQLFFVCCPAYQGAEDAAKYHLGGMILFLRDFQHTDGSWLTGQEVQDTVASYQAAAAGDTGIPLLIGIDEEGGDVARASQDPFLFSQRAMSPQALVRNSISFAADARSKSETLLQLGINVNLAPVCDIATNSNAYIYSRTRGLGAEETSAYVTEVVSAMRDCGIGSVLKHFPGYGGIPVNTHHNVATDERPINAFTESDYLPFLSGMEAGGDTTAVLVTHTIVECMDTEHPASLSGAVHEILRNDLNYDGVIMTDNLAMAAALAGAGEDSVAVLALEAGNDMLIITDYWPEIPKVISAVESGRLTEQQINDACYRVLRWKYALGLLEL